MSDSEPGQLRGPAGGPMNFKILFAAVMVLYLTIAILMQLEKFVNQRDIPQED